MGAKKPVRARTPLQVNAASGHDLHDRDIREPLCDFLEETFGTVRILQETRMGNSRADLVMVTRTSLIGLEIKSDADSYTRLRSQIADYDLYFDRNYVVVGTSHAFHIEEHVPIYWGIITAERENGEMDFYLLRRAKDNPRRDGRKKLSLLWRPELAHIQEINGMYRYAQKSKDFVIDKIFVTVSEETLASQISAELFERDYSQIMETINRYREEHGRKKRRRRKRRNSRSL